MHIEIIEYPVFMRIGCFREERLHGQEVLVTVFAEIRMESEIALGDDLRKTLDYGDIIRTLDTALKDREFKLIESAVIAVGQSLMGQFLQVEKLDVTIEKPVLPGGMAKGGRIRIHETFLSGGGSRHSSVAPCS
ncbi:MAG: dihydroneopterin aldolase [Pseudomonadota bacterium]